jgi:hypothetical protein
MLPWLLWQLFQVCLLLSLLLGLLLLLLPPQLALLPLLIGA